MEPPTRQETREEPAEERPDRRGRSNLKLKRKKNSSELKQLHNLELLVRNEETAGFVAFYLQNQR